jgi:hypothetical protein
MKKIPGCATENLEPGTQNWELVIIFAALN